MAVDAVELAPPPPTPPLLLPPPNESDDAAVDAVEPVVDVADEVAVAGAAPPFGTVEFDAAAAAAAARAAVAADDDEDDELWLLVVPAVAAAADDDVVVVVVAVVAVGGGAGPSKPSLCLRERCGRFCDCNLMPSVMELTMDTCEWLWLNLAKTRSWWASYSSRLG